MPDATVSVYREPNLSRSVIIADGATESDEEDLQGESLVGAYLPASLEGTTLSFLAAAVTGGTFLAIEDTTGALVSFTVESSRYVPFDPVTFSGVRFLKLKTGTAQTGAATVVLATRRLG